MTRKEPATTRRTAISVLRTHDGNCIAFDPKTFKTASAGTPDAALTRLGGAHHRRMSMTPLGPRELGGLKGFGFTVNFESPSSEPIPPTAETKAAGVSSPAPAATNSEPAGLVEAAI